MSNSNKVSVNKLSNELIKYLTKYKEDIEEEVTKTANEVAFDAQHELKTISPKANKNVYTRKWQIQKVSGEVISPR